MKEQITSSLQILAKDRHLLTVLALLVFISLSLLVYLVLAISPSERQVAVHYTAFGSTNFYRDKWYYLLNFVVYSVLMAVMHILMTFKIYQENGRLLAIAFAWLGVVIAGISASLIYQILKIASII